MIDRLRSYQTSSPHRDYHLHYSRWFPDACAAEAVFKSLYPGHVSAGEWHTIHPEDAANLIDLTATHIKEGLPDAN